MKVYFQGLITHALLPPLVDPELVPEGPELAIRAPDERVAAIYRAHGHLARVYIPTAETDYECYRLVGRVRFTLPGGAAPMVPAAVPSLDRLMPGGRIHPDAQSRTTGGPFVAFVDIVGGSYSIADYFAYKGMFDDQDRVCMPRTLLWNLDLTPPNVPVTITGGDLSITFPGTATLYIVNLPPPAQPAPAGHHFDHYKIFKNRPEIDRPEELTGVDCELYDPRTAVELPHCPGEGEPAITTVECVNTQFP